MGIARAYMPNFIYHGFSFTPCKHTCAPNRDGCGGSPVRVRAKRPREAAGYWGAPLGTRSVRGVVVKFGAHIRTKQSALCRGLRLALGKNLGDASLAYPKQKTHCQ